MGTTFGNVIAGGVDRLVRWVVLPATGAIDWLARTGLLFLGFAALWLALLLALVVQPASVEAAWRSLNGQPLVAQAAAWLLFLPLTAGLWIWSTDWPLVVRAALVVALCTWNLLVFLPRPHVATAPTAG